MQDNRPVEVVGFHLWKIPEDTQDRPRTDGLEPVLGDLYRLTVASSFGLLVHPRISLGDLSLTQVVFQVRRKNNRPQFILCSFTPRARIVFDAHKVGMLHVIR